MDRLSKQLKLFDFTRTNFGGLSVADLWYSICSDFELAYKWMKFASIGPYRYFSKSDCDLIEAVQMKALVELSKSDLYRASLFVGESFTGKATRSFLIKSEDSRFEFRQGFLLKSIRFRDDSGRDRQIYVDVYLAPERVHALLYQVEPLTVRHYHIGLEEAQAKNKRILMEAFTKWGISNLLAVNNLALGDSLCVSSGCNAVEENYPHLFRNLMNEEKSDTYISISTGSERDVSCSKEKRELDSSSSS